MAIKNIPKLIRALWQRPFPCRFEHRGNLVTEQHGKFLAGLWKKYEKLPHLNRNRRTKQSLFLSFYYYFNISSSQCISQKVDCGIKIWKFSFSWFAATATQIFYFITQHEKSKIWTLRRIEHANVSYHNITYLPWNGFSVTSRSRAKRRFPCGESGIQSRSAGGCLVIRWALSVGCWLLTDSGYDTEFHVGP